LPSKQAQTKESEIEDWRQSKKKTETKEWSLKIRKRKKALLYKRLVWHFGFKNVGK